MRISAAKMAGSVSATSLVKHRPGFGYTVRPAKGSVLAAIGSAGSQDEPDYFFHWLRDSAAIMDAALILIRNGIDADAWRERFADFVRFSLDLSRISGAAFLAATDMRSQTAPEFQQYLRPDAEIAAVEGDAVLGDVRYNADGTLDFERWGRPQHDGPAARALTVLRFLEAGAVPDDLRDEAARLLRLDLDYTLKHAGAPCFDIWEEEVGEHYYTLLLQSAALRGGMFWAGAQGETDYSHALADAMHRLQDRLEDFWSPDGYFRSRIMPPGATTTKALDSAVMLGLVHIGTMPAGHAHSMAGRMIGRHSVTDSRAADTVEKLEAQFAADYAINRNAGPGLAFGRYRGDTYISGGAWYICTFGAAEFYYKLAAAEARFKAAPAERTAQILANGDAILEFARRFVPETGELSEQFDQKTGEQTSAKDLTWSNAAFITAWQARTNALARTSNDGPVT